MLQVLWSCHTTSTVCLNASAGWHREQGKGELGTNSVVVAGCFLAGVEMCPEAAEAAESSGIFGHTVSDSVITEHFVI